MKYLYLDGDNIGQEVAKLFMDNNEDSLREFTNLVKNTINEISFFVQKKDLEIIFSGADGIIGKGDKIDGLEILKFAREKSSDITFSIGVGSTLKDAFYALKYAKSCKKNVSVELSKNEFIIQR